MAPLAPIALVILAILIMILIRDRIPGPWASFKKSLMIGQKNPFLVTSLECPYSYIRKIYGHHHWAPFVNKLSSTLRTDHPLKYELILDIMDGVHLCAILIDDIFDGSNFRKGLPAAHRIYGASETANRAYYRVSQLLNRTVREFPSLAPFLMQCIEEIHEGQDLTLVWRRDGLAGFPTDPKKRLEMYKHMAWLKTGALFRLFAQLALEDHSMDETMNTVAWCAQVQNDCKNVYSTDYGKAKGAIAEDLQNGELSFPIVVALNTAKGYRVARALEYGSPRNMRRALRVIRSAEVRDVCLAEMKMAEASLKDWAAVWGRDETMDIGAVKKAE